MERKTKLGILVKLDPPQLEELNELSRGTRVPRSVLIREAIDSLLKKHRDGAPKPRSKR